VPPVILVVDDEKNIRRTLRMVLEGEGYSVEEAGSAEEGLAVLESSGIDAVLLDVKLPGISGIDALTRRVSLPPTIMISGHATIDHAVRATKLGAFDFLEKPLDRARVLLSVRNALDRRTLAREVDQLRARLGEGELTGGSVVMQTLRTQIAKAAPTRGRILITGESGTGKELVARAVHRGSALASRPFVRINCAAIPPDLIESELFGHERGAFTGAVAERRGVFEAADGGTLLLDEIGDMSASAQAKVLRVLQTGELVRVGGEETVRVDVRVLAATNKDLSRAVRDGEFREDLYFRLNVIPLHVPPLRERRDDIPLLAESFAEVACRENGWAEKPIDAAAMDRLCAWSWPGNVRELKNAVERAVILSGDRILTVDLPEELRGATESSEVTLREFRDRVERDFIARKLEQHGWNVSRTAEALGIERTNLHRKLRALGLPLRRRGGREDE
jgi:two-component system, NtrC family, nitrogen regulation response regulator NtrX